MKTLLVFLAVLAAVPGQLKSAQPAIAWDGAQAQFYSDDDGPFTLGFQFRAESDITVTSLGAFDYLGDGFATEHWAAIWKADGGEPIATAVLPAGTGASLLGQFRYVDIPGVTLSAGSEYVVGASGHYGSINDIYAGSVPVNAFSTPAAVTFLGARGSGEGAGLNFPIVHFEPLSPTTFGANFRFVVVPEPATWALLGVGLALIARRDSGSTRPRNPHPPLTK